MVVNTYAREVYEGTYTCTVYILMCKGVGRGCAPSCVKRKAKDNLWVKKMLILLKITVYNGVNSWVVGGWVVRGTVTSCP